MIHLIKNLVSKTAYHIGFFNIDDLHLSSKNRYNKISWLVNDDSECWYADPFILTKTLNKIELLVEKYPYTINKGVISRLSIDIENNKYILKSTTTILELETHLSFPYIYRDNGKVYVMPENSASGKLTIYEYNSQQDALINGVVVIDEPMVDSALFKLKDTYFIIGTIEKGLPLSATNTSYIYYSKDLLGPYNYLQTLKSEYSLQRGAGEVIVQDNTIFRPVQYCGEWYGEFVVMQKLTFENGLFVQEYVNRIEPNYGQRYSKCLHTYNTLDNICVIDGYDYVHYKLMNFIHKFL